MTKRLFSSLFGSVQTKNIEKIVPLHYKKVTSNLEIKYPPLVVLHGLLGSSRSFSHVVNNKKIKDHRECYMLDLRNHGESPHTNEFSYDIMKYDIL